ncbi:MAG: RNA-binding protein [Beijerinckiaceae bacterium]|nr:RNA-binding protein [Beijerinckiaceae bacterium]
MAKPKGRNLRAAPGRTCAVTRAKASPQDMIRFVAGPDSAVVADLKQKLPGRGVWILGHADLVEKAVKSQAFCRGFKAKVNASPHLAAEVDAQMTRDCLQALSLANKAGQVISGFAKAADAIASGAVSGLIHAESCGADGIRKLEQGMRRRYGGDQRERPQIGLFRSGQLDLALGRTNVIHAALVEGAASQGFLDCCRRLSLYRTASPRARGRVTAGRGARDLELIGLEPDRHAETD